MTIADGAISVNTANNGMKSDGTIDITGGTIDIQTDDDGLVALDGSISETATVTVNGESITDL